MSINNNGLIYYKLDYTIHGYNGDTTKNCGLKGEEIDGNFYFLRGHDIESISFVDNNLTIKRYNGEELNAIITNKNEEYDFIYDNELGVLTIITPSKEKIILNGFSSTNIYHDNTLEGKGTQISPLKLANISKTGRYLPAIKLIDTINSNEKLPTENINLHDRYVTKEKINKFGRLYSLNGVNKINEYLKNTNSEWHVPSKEEWDEILNIIDCNNPNHNKNDINIDLGEIAGAALKSIDYWKNIDGNVLSSDIYDFSIYPVGYYNKINNYNGLNEISTFWTLTKNENNDVFIKTFSFDKETVNQNVSNENSYFSLRLVKKNTGDNFNYYENINGYTCECISIPNTSTIWTKYNIDFSHEQYDSFLPSEWSYYDDDNEIIRYFINDWNGNEWDKHELKEGEGIILYENENNIICEFILINGNLLNISTYINDNFEKEITELKETLSENVNNINNELSNEIARATNTENDLIKELENSKYNLNDKLNKEITRAKNEEIVLKELLFEEEKRAINVENELRNLLSENINNTNIELKELLNQEITRATIAENDLNNLLSENINNVNNINNELSNEIVRATNAENDLNIKLETKYKDLENKLNYNGENAINVNLEKKSISLKINENEKILLNNSNGLSTNLSLKKDVTNNNFQIQLIGNNNELISFIHINELLLIQTEIQLMKEQIKTLTENLTELKNKSITNITGVDNEISVTVTDNTAKIGFAENAQFIAG